MMISSSLCRSMDRFLDRRRRRLHPELPILRSPGPAGRRQARQQDRGEPDNKAGPQRRPRRAPPEIPRQQHHVLAAPLRRGRSVWSTIGRARSARLPKPLLRTIPRTLLSERRRSDRPAEPAPSSFCQPRCSGGNRAEPYTKALRSRQLGQASGAVSHFAQAPLLRRDTWRPRPRRERRAFRSPARRDHICGSELPADSLKRSRRCPISPSPTTCFSTRTGMDPGRVETLVGEALAGMDDGELFLEYSQSESVALDDGRIKSASFDTTQGFGLRAVAGEAAGYAHASELSEAAIRRAAAAVRAVASGHPGTLAEPPSGTNRSALHRAEPARHGRSRRQDASCWPRSTPMPAAATRASGRSWPRSPASGRRCRSSAPDGRRAADIRPLVRLNVAIVVGEGDRMETGSHGAGGRVSLRILSRSGATGRRRSTRRCARRWSISARCRRRPAR